MPMKCHDAQQTKNDKMKRHQTDTECERNHSCRCQTALLQWVDNAHRMTSSLSHGWATSPHEPSKCEATLPPCTSAAPHTSPIAQTLLFNRSSARGAFVHNSLPPGARASERRLRTSSASWCPAADDSTYIHKYIYDMYIYNFIYINTHIYKYMVPFQAPGSRH
jgi:hypothetical protein